MVKSIKISKLIKNRDFWLAILIIALGFYFAFFQDTSPLNSAHLEIDSGEKRRAFEGEIVSSMSVLDALLAASRGGDFEVRYAIIKDATDVMKINGWVEDGLDGKWNFYLNDRKVEANQIHKTPIKAGDKILIKFE